MQKNAFQISILWKIKNNLKKARNIFNKLKTDAASVVFVKSY